MNQEDRLYGLVRGGSWRVDDGTEFACRIEDAGEVTLPSGRVCVGDPYIIDAEEQTIGHVLAPGRYRVRLCIADDGAGNVRVAGAALVIGEGDVVSWERAAYGGVEPLDEDELDEDEEDEAYGYGVDLASSCFAPAEMIEPLSEADDDALDDWNDLLTESIEAAEQGGQMYCEVSAPGGSLIMFPSGWGDGFYYNWWGLNENGERVVLLTAFDMLDAMERVE